MVTRPQIGHHRDAQGAISVFANPTTAFNNDFAHPFPGQSGSRNLVRGDGYAGLDMALSKRWAMPKEGQSLQFRWEVFNVPNLHRFNVESGLGTSACTCIASLQQLPSSFGDYTGACCTSLGRCSSRWCLEFLNRTRLLGSWQTGFPTSGKTSVSCVALLNCSPKLKPEVAFPMTTLAHRLRLVDYFALAFGVMVGTAWLVVMDDILQRGGPLGAILGFTDRRADAFADWL